MLADVKRLRGFSGLVLLCVVLAGCASERSPSTSPAPSGDAKSSGSEAANTSAIEPDLVSQIDDKLGVEGTRVDCPEQINWSVGDSFHCDVAVPGSGSGIVVLTLEADGGKFGWYLTNTCDGQEAVMGTPAAGCIDPDPSRLTDCPFVKGHLKCATESARP